MHDEALDLLVRELLLERTEGLGGPALAAFVDGWSSLLDLIQRTDLLLPGSPPQLSEGIATLVQNIRDAQERVLDESANV